MNEQPKAAVEIARETSPPPAQGQGKGSLLKFVILSLIGVFVFFIPCFDGQVPMVAAVNLVKKLLGPYVPFIAVAVSISLIITLLLGKVFHIKAFEKHHSEDKVLKIGFYILGFVMIAMILSGVAPQFMMDERIGSEAIYLASTIFMTITLAGWMVCFILESGIVEFFSVLIEPVMRPVYKLPGEAAVDAVSAFVSSAAVGVYITDQHYKDKRYTHKEAYAVVTSFCVMSVGYLGVLTEIAGVAKYYSIIVISAFVVVAIIAAITIRIPPLSRIPNVYCDGTVQTAEQRKAPKREHRFQDAVEAAVNQSRMFSRKSFFASLLNAVSFAQKIMAFLVPIVVLVLGIAYYTPVFEWIGRPIVPILELLRMPDAVKIAPATLIGIIEVSLPAISIAGLGVSAQSAFFVVVLSAVQIIFFTEAANAMLEASFKTTAPVLVVIFIIRTIIAIPLVALISHLLF